MLRGLMDRGEKESLKRWCLLMGTPSCLSEGRSGTQNEGHGSDNLPHAGLACKFSFSSIKPMNCRTVNQTHITKIKMSDNNAR